MQCVTLNNGIIMPMVGYGSFQINDLKRCEQCVLDAFETGYRLIDTASLYKNEVAVGSAIKNSGIPRSELFITTKLWPQDNGYENTLKAFDLSMRNLGLDYLDLYLIHQPFGDYYSSWRAMEKLLQDGSVHAIGVCNFASDRLVDLCMNCEVTPAVNQIEIHPFFQQQEAASLMKKYQVQQEAWGPLCEGQKDIFQNSRLVKIGEKYGKTAAQVVLRWHIQCGNVVIPKSVHKERIKENMDIWDFKLSKKDMTDIMALDIGHSEIINHRNASTAKWLNEWKIHE